MIESLRLVPYIDSREDGRSSSHKGIEVGHWSCTSRTKFFVLLLELGTLEAGHMRDEVLQ